MRRLLTVTAITLAGLLAASTAAQAAAAPTSAPSSSPTSSTSAGTSTDMPGMTMPTNAPSTAPSLSPQRQAQIVRARQRPLFLEAQLSGANEVQVPGKPPVGDPKGSATGIVRVQGNQVTFAFSWQGISAPTLGHIHQGVTGVNGDVKVPLFLTPMPSGVSAAAGAVTVSDPAIADAIRANPSGFYLNLHTKEFPGGAVRGQLTKLRKGSSDLLDMLDARGLRANLSGDQEVPTVGGPAVGDPTGRAVAYIHPQGTEVSYAFAWIGLNPTLGHIHQGAFGTNGKVVVPLFTSAIPTSVFAVAGTVTGVDPALVRQIDEHPRDFYTNLHTAQFPGGAARGQLFGHVRD
ncbi:CHRD domain-containing protein [Catenulispora rubra]|uniref:CHRD domain-containing protein n=1 Tax=Catenulispora rubra TaxID=280293 RepID=UPI001892543B|nr:CHRD domain-containing protein [Catenulispora rubra]